MFSFGQLKSFKYFTNKIEYYNYFSPRHATLPKLVWQLHEDCATTTNYKEENLDGKFREKQSLGHVNFTIYTSACFSKALGLLDCVLKEKVSKRDNTTAKFMFKIMIRKTNKPYFYNCLSALKKLSNVSKKGPPILPSNDRTCRYPAGKYWYITSEFKRSSSIMIKLSSRQIHESSIDFSLHNHYFLWKGELTQEVQKSFKQFQKQPRKIKPVRLGRHQKRAKIIHP